MIEQRPLSEATVSPGVPKLLQESYYVRFTKEWPTTLPTFSGKFFQIERTNQVPYILHYILPTTDFRDVDLSNATGGENIYPENPKTLYEVLIGFKKGNYLAHWYIPAGEYVHRLDQASMVPTVTSPTLRYLGATRPEDSPCDDKRIFCYFVKDLEPLILRLYVLPGVDWEKCSICLLINKCRLKEIAPTAEQLAKAKTILYYTELRW